MLSVAPVFDKSPFSGNFSAGGENFQPQQRNTYCSLIVKAVLTWMWLFLGWFLPCDVMRSVACTFVQCLSFYLSVCLSVTFEYYIEMSKHAVKIFSPSDSLSILVFLHQTFWKEYANLYFFLPHMYSMPPL